MSKHAIERLAKFSAQNKQYFLISAMIINNAICTNLLQHLKMITLEPRVAAYVLDEVGWKSGEFAERLHREMNIVSYSLIAIGPTWLLFLKWKIFTAELKHRFRLFWRHLHLISLRWGSAECLFDAMWDWQKPASFCGLLRVNIQRPESTKFRSIIDSVLPSKSILDVELRPLPRSNTLPAG
jgi:hypothetical protein